MLKFILKYHNKGITTITQLSYLFKPRKRRAPNLQSSYLWELKALAIREQKAYVIQPPELNPNSTAIFLDFEGTANEQHPITTRLSCIHFKRRKRAKSKDQLLNQL